MAQQQTLTLSKMLAADTFKRQLAAALPRHLTAERLARIALTEVRKNPGLQDVEPRSFLGAVIQAGQLGLEPGNALGHAYILPYKKRGPSKPEAQLILGYRGMIDLARRSGQIISISARSVYSGDQFSFAYGLNEDLRHVPSPGHQRGDLTHVYAVARLIDGGVQFEVMSTAEIQAVRQQSKATNEGPWATHFEEMAKKTVIRRLFKYLPVSIEIQRAVGLDELAEAGVDQGNADVIEGELGDPVDTVGDIAHNLTEQARAAQ